MIDLADSAIQERITYLFPKDAPSEGGVERLAELQAQANATTAPERARKVMCLAREYRRVEMGL